MSDKVTSVDLKKLMQSEEVIIGTDKTLKSLKLGKVKKVMVASNCVETVIKSLKHYAKLGNAEFIKLGFANDELGLICKKPFSISVLGFRV
tara:strand:- start:193 stop:465 length:273 start_codon:yes stop_codon:yes gene_type:complete